MTADTAQNPQQNPWPALWALVIGFFMILVDVTIVTVATPAIMRGLDADVGNVIWVSSAYMLAYAVPLLITGRLGDRVGPKWVYMAGLALFTGASLWCGLTSTIGELITARVVQGLGASLMTPQTMSVITRTFPAERRGTAMSLWGAVSGVAMIVGPVLGGLLVDGPGWEWIFFVNVPVGIVAFVLAWRLVPDLPTHNHDWDWLGVALSAVAMFCIVFGIQEGERYQWGTITGFLTVPLLIAFGVVVFAAFVFWQSRNRREPLVPLGIFRDRNFSLANSAIATVGLAMTSMGFPFMLWAQLVRGLSPMTSGLLMLPMAVCAAIAAPFVGRMVDRVHPRIIPTIGLLLGAGSIWWTSSAMTATGSWIPILASGAVLGLANACMWAPLAATSMRNLDPASAGAGSGIYNATRQVGSVIGAAAIAALIEARLAANLPGASSQTGALGTSTLPEPLHVGFSAAMSESLLLLCATALLVGALAAVLLKDGRGARADSGVA